MDPIRKGEIALAVLKFRLRKNLSLLPDVQQEIALMSRETGVDRAELYDLMDEIVQELLNEAFPQLCARK